jgi:hypothetical protein
VKNYSKILIISIFLYIFSIVNSFADYNWKKLGSNISGNVFYIDTSSIKKNGSKVFYFSMNDYAKPSKFGDLSSRVYMEVNCLNLDYRYLKDFYYQEPMGNGEPSTIFDEVGKWEVTAKGSIGEVIRKFACNYK